MTHLVFHHNHRLLPSASGDLFPVQLYGLNGQTRGDISVIGNPVIDKIKRLGVKIPSQTMDFLTIALAVTAADTFVPREYAEDGWSRHLSIQLPLHEPALWQSIKEELERALHFLSGDMWSFDFQEDGYESPTPYRQKDRFQLLKLRNLDCVSLFSGGLDSAIGAIDLLEQGRSPLLVSHAYKGDKAYQDKIYEELKGRRSRFAINADPHVYTGETDITMRTRSFNFLAFAAVGASAVQAISQEERIDLFVPENGFISLNAPLTQRRIGTLSTRTTHPHFIACIQSIFNAVNIPCNIINPYQFKTKGQMVSKCQNRKLLESIVDKTVSCSHWKRSNQQCGICVPCIIRRSSIHAGQVNERIEYSTQTVSSILNNPNLRDDVLALRIAISQKSTRKPGAWIIDSGPLPAENYEDHKKTFLEGLNEVESFLKAEGAL